MASSSSHQMHTNQNPLEEVSGELGELGKEERGKDWLELGLGFSCGCKKPLHEQSYPVSSTALASASSPSLFLIHHQWHPQQIQPALGLGLEQRAEARVGFDYKGVRCMNREPPSNNHTEFWQDQYHYQDQDQDQDHDHKMPFWAWQMNSSNHLLHWQFPIFNVPNDYRPHPGFWFTLISSTNRFGEAPPQVPKAYIRVKDENMTVFIIKKYLVTKLGLSNEAEVDISCMGLSLLQTLTLKQVRDDVWLPRLVQSVNSATAWSQNTQDMCMPLHYVRSCLLNLN